MADGDDVERFRKIWIDPREDPVTAVVEDDARRAAVAYPKLAAGAPAYGSARSLGGDRWRIIYADDASPQAARDGLAHYFRKLAAQTEDPGWRREFEAAYTRLEWEKVDEISAGDQRVRVIRVERFIRRGPDGPEPPRPTDPDKVDLPDGRDDRLAGLVIDPGAATGWGDASMKMDLLASAYPASAVPAPVRADSLRALEAYPGGVLLPVVFTCGELVDGGRWEQAAGCYPTPSEARAGLAYRLRWDATNWHELGIADPGERMRHEWLAIADRIDAGPSNEIRLPDRTVRVVRVEQLVRFGADGPEPPRPSDPDHDLPVEVWAQLHPEALSDDPDDDG
jgi:hypothetical protein